MSIIVRDMTAIRSCHVSSKSRNYTFYDHFFSPFPLYFRCFFFYFSTESEDGARYSGLADAVMKIYTQEGVLAFWTGFGAYYMRTAPHAMIILMTTQPITDHYKRTFNL